MSPSQAVARGQQQIQTQRPADAMMKSGSCSSLRFADENEYPLFNASAHRILDVYTNIMDSTATMSRNMGKQIGCSAVARDACAGIPRVLRPRAPTTSKKQRKYIDDSEEDEEGRVELRSEKTAKKSKGRKHIAAPDPSPDDTLLARKRWVVIDMECVPGTGQEIVEIAAVHLRPDGDAVRPVWHTLVNPETPMLSWKGESKDPITDEMLHDQPTYEQVHEPFILELEHADYYVVAYNAQSERSFMEKAVCKAGLCNTHTTCIV
jgi:hypothetical protein